MKKIIATTTMMALLISSNMNAAAKNAPVELEGLRKAIDEMLASFEDSVGPLSSAIEDRQQTMATFDNILANIKYAIQQTTKDGRLSKLLAKAVDTANRQVEWCEEQGESRYTELAVEFAKKAKIHQTQLNRMLSLNADLAKYIPVIEGDKKYYLAVCVLGKLELARQAVDISNERMQKVRDLFLQMYQKEIKTGSKR